MPPVGTHRRFNDVRSYVRSWGDCVAKLFAALQRSNYRIRLSAVLNRCCAPVLALESILLNLVAKIVLQHNRHKADLTGDMQFVRFRREADMPRPPAAYRSGANDPKRSSAGSKSRSAAVF